LHAEVDLQRRAIALADERLTETAAWRKESQVETRRPNQSSEDRVRELGFLTRSREGLGRTLER
jgi:hypothetical protein